MKIVLLVLGKSTKKYVINGCAEFEKRIHKYVTYEMKTIPDIKNAGKLRPPQLKEFEAELILRQIQTGDKMILLDEKGKEMTSMAFADFLQKQMLVSIKRLVFVVGGAYGFAPSVYQKADMLLSLSQMTFSHQLIRLLFAEQLYRGLNILHGDPYHNE